MKNVEWGEYKLIELFDISGTKSLDSNAVEFVRNGINFIGRTCENNGIQGKISKQSFEPNEPMTITATVIGNYKYVKLQKDFYYCSQNINKLTPINKKITVWNEKIAYFFVTEIQKFVSLYNGQQGGYKLEDIKSHRITLPTKSNQIDFEFMESFIAELEAERIAELEAERIAELSAYLTVSGLDNYELSDEEQQALDNLENVKWGEYKVIDIFDVKNTHNILSRDIKENSGKIPYLGAGDGNNSVISYISYDINMKENGECIFIGGKTFVVTYQQDDFFSNDSHNLALYIKDSKLKNKPCQLALVSCIYKGLKHKYSWGDSISNRKIQKDVIQLPQKNGQIDFEFMQTLISAIQKLVIKDVVLYTNKNIETTKIVISDK